MSTSGARRGVTRAYVVGLALMVTALALALLVAAWGFLALLAERRPVSGAETSVLLVPGLVLAAAAALVWVMWRSAIALLRGRSGPPWSAALLLAVGVFLFWGLAGSLLGLGVRDAWTTPFPLVLALLWPLALLLFWLILVRRTQTDRPPPRWPWEKREEAQRAAEDAAERAERETWGPDGPVDLGN